MPESGFYLAIDAGTTMVKAALVGGGGLDLGDVAACRLDTLMPQKGYCEMDMEAVWLAACEVMATLRQRQGRAWEKIKAVGICAQGEGLWPLDENKRPARRAILWNDTRSRGPADLEAVNRLCLSRSSAPLSAGSAPLILLWLKENEPDVFAKINTVIHCKDWLNFRLTGRIVTDYSDASTSLLNIFSKKYEFEILEALGLGDCVGLFPRAVPSASLIGGVLPEAAAALRLKAGTPVIAGALDVLAVATGCGATRPGRKGSAIGTTLSNFVALNESQAKEQNSLSGSLLCHALPDTYIKQMASLSGASTLDWVRNTVLGGESYDSLSAAMAEIPPGADGVIYLPYIYGERAPFRLPEAGGCFFGLRAHHGRYHLARAAFEGLALSLKDCCRNLPRGETGITVAGGAAANELLCQIMADCLGQPLRRLKQRELGLAGVALLLCLALTGKTYENDSVWDEFLPNSGRQKLYQDCYRDFNKLKETLMPLWGSK